MNQFAFSLVIFNFLPRDICYFCLDIFRRVIADQQPSPALSRPFIRSRLDKANLTN